LLPALKPYFDRFASAGGDPALLRPVLGVEPAYLHAAVDGMHSRFGTIEAYFSQGLGIDAADQQSLHTISSSNHRGDERDGGTA
jgi:protein-tyrosine phosphatase